MVDDLNEEPGDLTGFDCPCCKNRGFFWRVSDVGERYCEECSCMITRRNLLRLKHSGLADMVERYSFARWRSTEKWQEEAAHIAAEYAENPCGWFYVAGRPGTGKTHLCTAICSSLIKRGYETRYLLWREFTTQAKAAITDAGKYEELVEPVKKVKVLYIDDFFKTGKGQEPTTGDTNLAFEILNARYNNRRSLTIFSSELQLSAVMDVDEAVGSRIYQMARNHYIDLSDRENYRLNGEGQT